MLSIDDKMLNLAKMQETLLERSISDRKSNLEKYKKTVKTIDQEAFSCILAELDKIKEHNQTLEDELQFLQSIKVSYEQLLEQQLSFRRVCELYGDKELELSDLSQIDIDYIENRINIISGYLINRKNLDDNKEKIEKLNEQLYEANKKHDFLVKKLQDYEQLLRDIFLNAEGRISVDGNLIPTSVVLEYKELGFDFKTLLYDSKKIDKLLEEVMVEANDSGDKYRTAEICYNNVPNATNKQILDEISKEHLKVKYKLIMLKILKLLAANYDDYDMFLEKREQLLDLIKRRNTCLKQLEISNFVDSFNSNKILEQIKEILSFGNNRKDILKIKREIAELNEMIEKMDSQNTAYTLELNNTKNLLFDKKNKEATSILQVSWDDTNYLTENIDLKNQAVSIKDLPKQFNLGIATQKTNLVLIRVNSMLKESIPSRKEISVEVAPKLVVIPSTVHMENNEPDDSKSELIDSSTSKTNENGNRTDNNDSSIFETLVPFEEVPMFTDKMDDSTEHNIFISDSLSNEELANIRKSEDNKLELHYSASNKEGISDDFWITQSDSESSDVPDVKEDSFEKQIEELLADDSNDKTVDTIAKTRKRGKDIMKNVA